MTAGSKEHFSIVVRDSAGKDETITVAGTKAEQGESGQLRIYDGEDQVFGGISIVHWHKVEPNAESADKK